MQEIGPIILILIVFSLVLILLIRSHIAKKQLEMLISQRTDELELQASLLKTTEEEAQAAAQAKSAFLVKLSHELIFPLNVIMGLTDLLLEENNLSGNVKENLHKINKAGSSLLGIVNDVLDFSKTETGKLILMPAEYHFASLLNDVINFMNTQIMGKTIVFQLNINNELPSKLYGDDLRVKQIFKNLLSNALKYTPSGTVELSVNVVYKNPEHRDRNDVWVEITVKDTGIGLSEENLKKLFINNSQMEGQTNQNIDDIDLGLSITRRLVEMMGGTLTAESEPGKGSVFRARIRQQLLDNIPIDPVVTDKLRMFNYTEDKRIVTKKLVRPDLSHIRVLVVDDMQTNLDVASGLLGKYKMQIDCVLSGQEAFDRICNGSPVYDAIFMDHMMPGMDGIETVDLIRSIGTDYSRKIPIIALTANATQGIETLFYAHDFQAYIPKPIDIIWLDSVIRKWVRPEKPGTEGKTNA